MREPSTELIEQAILAIHQAWQDGADKYPDDPWRELDTVEHLTHAADHAESVLWDYTNGTADITDINHAIFRLAAARWKMEQERANG